MHPALHRYLTGAALLAALLPTAHADGDRRALAAPPPPTYTQECGACHVAFPAGLLPAASWQHLMAGLTRHYGVDASLDAATTRELTAWLSTHAGSGKRAREAPPEDRITRSAWFLREHREVSTAAWQRPAIKSPSNCSACHAGADRGDFDEDAVRIPR